jgi:hypothetical protein
LWAQNNAKLCKNWIITLVFEKKVNFFAENWRKSQKTLAKIAKTLAKIAENCDHNIGPSANFSELKISSQKNTFGSPQINDDDSANFFHKMLLRNKILFVYQGTSGGKLRLYVKT